MLSKLSAGLKAQALQALARRGYKLVSTAPIDEREGSSNPIKALCLPGLPRPVLVDIPLTRLRGLNWFEADEHRHPFAAALAAYRDRGVTDYHKSPLSQYYEKCQPATVAEALGLKDGSPYAAFPSPSIVLPWYFHSPTTRGTYRLSVEAEEARARGTHLGPQEGTKFFGPVSVAKGAFELDRLIHVYDSMRQQGYVRNDRPSGDIAGRLLAGDDGDWCVEIFCGQHRIAAAAALQLASVPVRFREAPVRRSDARYWPQVVKGFVTEAEALEIFDRIMRGDPPPACRFDPSELLQKNAEMQEAYEARRA